MAATPYTLSGFVPQGDVLIKKKGDTTWTAIGNCSALTTQDKTTKKEQKSYMRDTAGQVLSSFSRMDGTDVSMTIDQFSMTNFMLALAGDSSLVTQTAVTDGTASITVELDKWHDIGKFKLSGVVVTVSSTEKNLGIDYELKADAGLIRFLSTGSIAAGASATVTYDAAAIASGSAYQIDGGKNPETECALLLDGYDQITRNSLTLEIWKIKLSPSGSVNYIGDDYNKVELKGSAETPEGYDSPYRLTVLLS